MKVVFGVVLLIFIILAFPIRLKAKIDFNLLKNRGIITFYVYNHDIKPQVWSLGFNKLVLHNNDKTNHTIVLFKGGNDAEYSDYLIFEILKVTSIHTIKLFATLGIKDNPMATALICSSMNIPTKIVLSIVKNERKNIRVVSQILPSYTEDKASIAINCSISINLLSLCFALIVAKHKQEREKIIYGKQSN